MIRVRIEKKAFGDTDVLGEIAFDVAQGERVALVGPSGIGKSTLLRIVAGLDASFQGTVERPDRLAMVFQEPTLLPWRSALDNVVLATRVSERDARARLAEVGLLERAGLFPAQLSLGQQRRLALARAFAARPRLFVLDEPFASLDEALADEMMDLVATLLERHGTTVVLVTHSSREAERLTRRTLGLQGSPARLVDG